MAKLKRNYYIHDRSVNALKSGMKKKLSGVLAFLMLATMLFPVLAFAANGFKDDAKLTSTGVTGSVYSDVYHANGVSVSVYSPTGVYLGVTNAVYDSVYNGLYSYRYTTAYGATYDWVSLKAYFNVSEAVYDSVYKSVYKESNPGFVGGGFFIPSNNEIDATNGTVSESSLKDAFAKADSVTVKIKEKVAIPANALVEAAKKAGTVLVIKGDNGTYELPLSVLKLEELAKKLGVELKDLKINVKIEKLTGVAATAVSDAAKKLGAATRSDAVDFDVTAEGKDGKTVKVDFNNTYVKRTMNLADTASKTVTVAMYTAEGTLRFVPSTIADKTATFKRTGNSVYVVIENEVSFSDVPATHWAKKDIELLASKLVVEGTGRGFEAERNITRAEFAALVVKALGLDIPSNSTATSFKDVQSGAWYTGYIAAAQAAGLIKGYEDGSFQPNKQITREELAALVVRAAKFAGVSTDVTASRQALVLAKYKDSSSIVWAQQELAAAIELGIVNGMTETTLVPKANATRAQSATMLKRLLAKADFID